MIKKRIRLQIAKNRLKKNDNGAKREYNKSIILTEETIMVLDSLKNAKLYACLGERFEQAFEFLAKTDLSALEVGKTELDGKKLYIAVSEYETKDVLPDFEAHDNYADIQVIVSGNERIDWCERADCFETVAYNPEKDIVRINTEKAFTELKIKAGQFAIFYPEDAHRPNLSDGAKTSVKKVVVKVLLH